MKKFITVLFLLSLLTGCRQPEKLVYDDPGNHESIDNFFFWPYGSLVVGEHFQVKMLPVYKYKDEDMSYYCYKLLVAPVYDEKLSISVVSVKAIDKLDEYQRYLAYNYGLSDGLNRELIHDIPLMEGKENMWAIRSDFIFYSSNKAQEEKKITDEELDGLLRNIEVTIKYNMFNKETISVTSGQLITVKPGDAILKERKDLEALVNCGEMYTAHTTAFSGKGYPADAPLNEYRRPKLFAWAYSQVTEKTGKRENLIISEGAHFYRYFIDKDNSTIGNATGNELYLIYEADRIIGLLVDEKSDQKLVTDESIIARINQLRDQKDYFELVETDDEMLGIWSFDDLTVIREGNSQHDHDEFLPYFPDDATQADPQEAVNKWAWMKARYLLNPEGE